MTEVNAVKRDAMVATAVLLVGLWGLRAAHAPAPVPPAAGTRSAAANAPAQRTTPYASLARAVDAAPASADRYAALGAAYLRADRRIEASLVLRVALVLDPSHAAARADYARARQPPP